MSDAEWMRALLACLYLDAGDGVARAPRHRAHQVLHCLRVHQPTIAGIAGFADAEKFVVGARVALRHGGFHEEAAHLGAQARLAQFVTVAADSLTMVGDPSYPARWDTSLGHTAPVVLWGSPSLRCVGVAQPRSSIRWFGVVGSRCPSAASLTMVSDAVRQAVALGYGIVTGGAQGVDHHAATTALRLGAPVLNLVPMCGFQCLRVGASAGTSLGNVASLRPAGTPFSTSAAMERNALIYAASDCTLVVQPRFKTGGTWHGALAAHQRKLCPLLVAEELDNMAYRAFRALGFGVFEASSAAHFAGGVASASSRSPLADAIHHAKIGAQPHLPFSATGS